MAYPFRDQTSESSTLNGWLIYQPQDLLRNRWFAAELCKEAARYGIRLQCFTADADAPQELPDCIINRSREARWSMPYEAQGIRCFNRAAVTAITNDKLRTYAFLQQHGIPAAPTYCIDCETQNLPSYSLPMVAKPLDGHGGEGVEWIADAAALERILRHKKRPFLLQAPMVRGWDLRVYLLGGKIYHGMLRTSASDFRSNYSLGGSVQSISPGNEICRLIEQVQSHLPLDFAGIDVLRHPDGGYVIGEIEDAVGCRMLYQHTSLQPAADYMKEIAAQLSRSSDAPK